MKSIKALFLEKQRSNPYWGDIICLVEAVRQKKFSKFSLRKAMDELIPETHRFRKLDKMSYLEFLHTVSNTPEEQLKQAKNLLKEV
jgi:hypothetical protein